MIYRKLLFTKLFVLAGFYLMNAQVNVDVNLNMKHSVDSVSDFGRERHMTIHSNFVESDWDGHEDMLDYLINDLDVYFGRETGNATWKMLEVEEDPNKSGWANEAQMMTHGQGLKEWYESDKFTKRHQYEAKAKGMIMGINDFSPMYPNLSYFPTFGKGKGGWFVKDTDAAADWVGKYMENYFAQSDDDIGDKLPKYWECYNEPDMNILNPSFGMIVSSLEKNWEYHKFVAQEVRTKLGDKAPKIGGMCWGQLDLYKPDAIPSRVPGSYWDNYSSAEAIGWYDVMLKGVGETDGVVNPGVGYDEWPKAWDNRTDAWWQWDFMYQGFIDYCGADMDFYSVHMYDWPSVNSAQDKANTRSGGHIEAMLDMFEWYDNNKFGNKKDIVMSEFGAVAGSYIGTLENGERDWPFIKSFNQMQMQILERPSHVVYSMPFAPTKATWGATFSGNNVIRYEGATLMEPRGTWTGDAATWTMNEPSEGWGWGKTIYFFELWKDVDGTRIDTKSDDADVQVDAYVNNNHVYLILNNCIDENKTISINTFSAKGNTVSAVEFRHLYKGDDDFPKYTIAKMTGAPAQVTLKPNSTIILDYTYASTVTIDEESKEIKYMCEPLAGNVTNKRGTQLCHTASKSSITATVKGVVKPEKGEAIIRIGGFFPNPLDGGPGMKVKKLIVNNNNVIVESDNFIANTRGYGQGGYQGAWFGVLELECPVEYLKDGDNEVYFERWQGVEFTTIMIQAFDMTVEPGRTTSGSAITGLQFNSSSEDVMEGHDLGLVPEFAPANALNKSLTWTSSNSSVVTVDENGVVTALDSTGTATITATSRANSSIKATITINAKPYKASTVTGISIVEGDKITVNQNINTKLNIEFTPSDIENAPEIEWTSGNSNIVEILAPGTIVGKIVGESTTVIATVKGTSIFASIDVTVALTNGEVVNTYSLPTSLTPMTSYDVTVPVEIMGTRSVLVELMKGSTVLGSGTKDIKAVGKADVDVSLNLVSVPAIGTGYEFRVTLMKGSEVLDTKTKSTEIKAPILVESVSLGSNFQMVKSATKNLSATISPSNASDKKVTWASSAPDKVSVDANTGKLTANNIGTADITVTTNDGSKTSKVTVTVVAFTGTLTIEAEGFDLTGGPQDAIGIYTVESTGVSGINNVQTGDWVEFDVYIPASGVYDVSFFAGTLVADAAIEFLIDGSTQGSVSVPNNNDWDTFQTVDFGKTVNLLEGSRTIRVKAVGSTQWQWNMDRFELKKVGDIVGLVNVDGVSLDLGSESVLVGSAFDLKETVSPSDASNKTVTWSSADESIASVINGKVTGEGVGVVKVYATTVDGGFKDSCEVTVNPISVGSIELNSDTETILIGGTFTFKSTVKPDDATYKNVTWSSSDELKATVDANGVVTGKALGSTEIKATAADGSGIFATATVTVTDVAKNVTKIVLSINDTTISEGATFKLTETIIPLDATNKNVTWSSSDIDVVIVDSEGFVTVEGLGTAKVYVIADDGGFKDSCTVVVKQPVTSVSIVVSSTKIIVGGGAVLIPTIVPSNATNKNVEWSSDNKDVVTVDANGAVTGVSVGVAKITVKTEDGGFTDEISITVEKPVSTKDAKHSKIVLYPNPANDYIIIGGLDDDLYKVRIYNAVGVMQITDKVTYSDNRIMIDKLHTGMYILIIETVNEVKVLRFQKK